MRFKNRNFCAQFSFNWKLVPYSRDSKVETFFDKSKFSPSNGQVDASAASNSFT